MQGGDKWFIVFDGEKLEKYTDIQETKRKYILWSKYDGKLNIREIDKQEIANDNQLTEAEQAKLDLLNLVNNPRLDKINQYFEQQSKLKDKYNKNWQDKLKAGLKHSTNFAKHLNQLIKQVPELFLDTISAKKDRLLEVKVEQAIERMFPELLREEKRKWPSFSGYWGLSIGASVERGGPENYLNPNEADELLGDDLDSKAENRHSPEVMEFRENINELLVSKILGYYNPDKRRWEKVYFPLSQELNDPVDEITVTLPRVKNLSRVALPKPLDAKIIKSRVKGIQADGKEVSLSTEVNSLGEATAISQQSVEKIVYSIEKSRVPEKMLNISAEEYHKYKQRFIKLFGEDRQTEQGAKERFTPLLENLAELPEELEIFLESIKDKPPKEQVVAIEEFVRKISYYDYDNGKVAALKRGKSIEEHLYIMEQRINELKQSKPELADKLKGKGYLSNEMRTPFFRPRIDFER